VIPPVHAGRKKRQNPEISRNLKVDAQLSKRERVIKQNPDQHSRGGRGSRADEIYDVQEKNFP